jgi:hypothetical protein
MQNRCEVSWDFCVEINHCLECLPIIGRKYTSTSSNCTLLEIARKLDNQCNHLYSTLTYVKPCIRLLRRCQINDLLNLLHRHLSELLWLLDFDLTVAGLKIHKGIVVGQLVAKLQIVRQLVFQFKQINIARFFGQQQNCIL